MACETQSGEHSFVDLRMDRGVPLEPPKQFQMQPGSLLDHFFIQGRVS